jgi:hypothetical protein
MEQEQTAVVDNEYITVRYLPDRGIVYHTVHKPLSGQTLRDALLAGTEAMKKNGGCKWLSDDRKNGPITEEDRVWGIENWNRPTIAAGWKYWACVVPEEVFDAGTLMGTMQALYELGLRMMVFKTLEEANAWLDKFEC